MNADIAALRMKDLGLSGAGFQNVTETVKSLGALQAQDYQSGLWALGVRIKGANKAQIEKAIHARQIVRTWPMRGTLHFIPAEDAGWMLELLTPRVIQAMKQRSGKLELDEKIITKCGKLLKKALQGGIALSRSRLLKILENEGISPSGGRGYHILCRLAHERLICYGPHEVKEPTFVLLNEWVKRPVRLSRDQSLVELARRYFTSHGLATLRDFVWWTGLKVSDARAGLEGACPRLQALKIDGREYWMDTRKEITGQSHPSVLLLPAFDEYLLGYTDRSAVLDKKNAPRIVPGSNGMFLATLVIDGQISGVWKRKETVKKTVLEIQTFSRIGLKTKEAVVVAGENYGRFLARPVEVRFVSL